MGQRRVTNKANSAIKITEKWRRITIFDPPSRELRCAKCKSWNVEADDHWTGKWKYYCLNSECGNHGSWEDLFNLPLPLAESGEIEGVTPEENIFFFDFRLGDAQRKDPKMSAYDREKIEDLYLQLGESFEGFVRAIKDFSLLYPPEYNMISEDGTQVGESINRRKPFWKKVLLTASNILHEASRELSRNGAPPDHRIKHVEKPKYRLQIPNRRFTLCPANQRITCKRREGTFRIKLDELPESCVHPVRIETPPPVGPAWAPGTIDTWLRWKIGSPFPIIKGEDAVEEKREGLCAVWLEGVKIGVELTEETWNNVDLDSGLGLFFNRRNSEGWDRNSPHALASDTWPHFPHELLKVDENGNYDNSIVLIAKWEKDNGFLKINIGPKILSFLGFSPRQRISMSFIPDEEEFVSELGEPSARRLILPFAFDMKMKQVMRDGKNQIPYEYLDLTTDKPFKQMFPAKKIGELSLDIQIMGHIVDDKVSIGIRGKNSEPLKFKFVHGESPGGSLRRNMNEETKEWLQERDWLDKIKTRRQNIRVWAIVEMSKDQRSLLPIGEDDISDYAIDEITKEEADHLVSNFYRSLRGYMGLEMHEDWFDMKTNPGGKKRLEELGYDF